jgi:photosynthetic reaction center cytochrome c subunit
VWEITGGNMHKLKWSGVILGAGVLGSILGLTLGLKRTPAQGGPASAPGGGTKTAGKAFKNIRVLKNIPANQLFPTMQFISASLGVRCGFCHVQGDFSKDTKRPKLMARKMIAMEFAINNANFGGRTEVTCNTCHRGSPHPESIPAVNEAAMNASPPGGTAREMNSPSAPAPDAIVSKYIQAVGGADALRKISSRVERGTLTGFGGRHFPVTVYAQAPDVHVTIMDTPRGESVTAYNGRVGWMSGGAGPPRAITGDELAAERLHAQFDLALGLKKLYPRLRVVRPEKVGGMEAEVLLGFATGQPPVKLDFDPQSGLLVRVETLAETPLGPNPTAVDYADYRQVNGIKVPFKWTIARPGMQFTIQVASVRQNVPIDNSKFAAPAALAAAVAH